MYELFAFSLEGVALSAMTVMVLREVAIISLPNELAGPGGRWINTCRKS